MAKRGERRPYGVRFTWDNGVKGCDTFTTAERAAEFAAEIERHAALRDMTVDIEIYERGTR